jgi:hypothetical protein
LAITTSVLLPLGVDLGSVNWVEELVPGATDTELQSCVRAYVAAPVAELVIRPAQPYSACQRTDSH